MSDKRLETTEDAPVKCPGCEADSLGPQPYMDMAEVYVQYKCGSEWWPLSFDEDDRAGFNESKKCLCRRLERAEAERDRLHSWLEAILAHETFPVGRGRQEPRTVAGLLARRALAGEPYEYHAAEAAEGGERWTAY